MSFHGYRTVYSGDEGRISPDRPTAKTKRCSRTSESSRRRRYSSRESMSPRSDQFSDNESTSHISIPSYKSSSDSEDDSRLAYAGAKFNSPPPAYLLPNPPTSWINASQVEQVSLNAMSSHLRQILKVSI